MSTVQTVTPLTRAGIDVVGVTPDATGDEWPNTGYEVIEVKNGSGAGITVTLDLKPTVDGAALVDPTVSIGAGVTKMIGPFPPSWYNDSVTGRAKATCSATATITIKVIKIVPNQ